MSSSWIGSSLASPSIASSSFVRSFRMHPALIKYGDIRSRRSSSFSSQPRLSATHFSGRPWSPASALSSSSAGPPPISSGSCPEERRARAAGTQPERKEKGSAMKFFEEPQVGRLTSSPVITRCASNPILKAADVPYKSDLVLNAGVTRFKGRYVMVFRNDIRTDDYTVRQGVRGVIAVTDDFEKFEVLSVAAPDNRNFVLFPEKIGGKYVRLERPFPIYGRPGYPERFDIWISDSPDLVYWGNPELLLGVEDVPFSNQKLGAGPPPVKTSKGWLTVFHASDFDATRGRDGFELTWKKRYSAGVMLLDLADPRKVVGMSKKPLLAHADHLPGIS